MSGDSDDPRPAAHWGTHHPEDQPARPAVAGLGRLVLEARNRLGPDATPEKVLAELRAGGIDANPDDITHWFEQMEERP